MSAYGRIMRAFKRDNAYGASIETMATTRRVLRDVELDALRRCQQIAQTHGQYVVSGAITSLIAAVIARGRQEQRTINKLLAASEARTRAAYGPPIVVPNQGE